MKNPISILATIVFIIVGIVCWRQAIGFFDGLKQVWIDREGIWNILSGWFYYSIKHFFRYPIYATIAMSSIILIIVAFAKYIEISEHKNPIEEYNEEI